MIEKIGAKLKEIDRMILMIYLDWRSPEITLMSVKLLERTLSVENSKVSAMQSADRIVLVSAIRFELMKLTTIDPWIGVSRSRSEKTHPNPAVNLFLFHASWSYMIRNCCLYGFLMLVWPDFYGKKVLCLLRWLFLVIETGFGLGEPRKLTLKLNFGPGEPGNLNPDGGMHPNCNGWANL